MPVDLFTLMEHPTFKGAEEQKRRYMLSGAGVPGAETDPIATVMARANAMREGQEMSQSRMQAPPVGTGDIVDRTKAAAADLPTRLMTGAVEMVKQGTPSTLGGIAGGIAAPYVGLPPQAGQMLGSIAGEGVAQAAGLNPVSAQQLLMAGAMPLAAKPLGKMAPLTATIPPAKAATWVGRIPGSAGALAEQSAEELRAVGPGLRATTAQRFGVEGVTPYFEEALARNERVPVSHLQATVKALVGEESLKKRGGAQLGRQYSGITEALSKALPDDPTTGVPLAHLEAWRKGYGAMLEREGDLNSQEGIFLRRVYGAVLNDMEAAAKQGGPGTSSLLQGIRMASREYAADDWEAMLDRVGFGMPRPDGIPDPRTGRILQEITKMEKERPSPGMRLFKNSIDQREFDDIKDTVQFWHERKVMLEPPKGVQHGSGPVNKAFMAGTAVSGGNFGVGAATATARWALTSLLMSTHGRAALKDLISKGHTINMTELTALAAGQMARQPLGANPAEAVQQIVQGMRAPGETRLEAVPK